MDSKWDKRFLLLAKLVSTWSKDPSTQCGAIITQGKRIISLGYNGFPSGVDDNPDHLSDREIKLQMILHAETNAILYSHHNLTNLKDLSIYTYPFAPCCRCASNIIQLGIRNVISLQAPEILARRWKIELDIASSMYSSAGASLTLYPQEFLND